MKVDKIIWWTIFSGIVGVLICVYIHYRCPQIETWKAFDVLETVLGYVANLAIVAAALRFILKKNLNIKGIGKIRISQTYDNIQDLTNLISRYFYEGKNFHRTPVLDAFYGENPMRVLEEDPEYKKFSEDASNLIKLNIKGEEFVVKRSAVRSLEALLDAVRWMHFKGEDIDKETRSAIYTEWYKIN